MRMTKKGWDGEGEKAKEEEPSRFLQKDLTETFQLYSIPNVLELSVLSADCFIPCPYAFNITEY